MDLFSKFDAVQVAADIRISETDKYFCEAHQKAYEVALSCFHELEYIWEDIYGRQRELLSEVETGYAAYLYSEGNIDISTDKISKHIMELHGKFLRNLVNYFNSTYHITIDCYIAEEKILPQIPSDKRRHTETLKKYESKMLNLILRYEDIVNFIFIQMDGRGFDEQAFHELHEKCHAAAWNSNQKKAKYDIKKNVLQFSYGCSFSSLYSISRWQLTDHMKDVLRGVAHYETGAYETYPSGFNQLLGYRCNDDLFEFPTSQKVKQIKMFKNNRVDIKFASEHHVRQFCDKYLGLVC